MPQPNPTRVLRRTLEDALDARTAWTVLFEALGAAESGVPRTLHELLSVVRGPLHEILRRRLDDGAATVLIEEIERRLTPEREEMDTLELSLDELMPEEERGDATKPVLRLRGAVTVSVLSEGTGFATRLVTALGENRVEAHAHALPEQWPLPEPPQVVVLDASDFPKDTTPTQVVAWSRELAQTTACVLWAPELPYGRRLQEEVGGGEPEWLTFDRREGIAPLLDLIRSRRRSS